MSWSVQYIGTPDAVCRALDENSTKILDSQSKAEFDEALPHLKGLVSQAVGDKIAIKLAASGHASFVASTSEPTRKVHGSISVSLEQFYGHVV